MKKRKRLWIGCALCLLALALTAGTVVAQDEEERFDQLMEEAIQLMDAVGAALEDVTRSLADVKIAFGEMAEMVAWREDVEPLQTRIAALETAMPHALPSRVPGAQYVPYPRPEQTEDDAALWSAIVEAVLREAEYVIPEVRQPRPTATPRPTRTRRPTPTPTTWATPDWGDPPPHDELFDRVLCERTKSKGLPSFMVAPKPVSEYIDPDEEQHNFVLALASDLLIMDLAVADCSLDAYPDSDTMIAIYASLIEETLRHCGNTPEQFVGEVIEIIGNEVRDNGGVPTTTREFDGSARPFLMHGLLLKALSYGGPTFCMRDITQDG